MRPGDLGSLLASWPGGLLGFGHLGWRVLLRTRPREKEGEMGLCATWFHSRDCPRGSGPSRDCTRALDSGREEVSPGHRPLSSLLDPSALVLASGSPRSQQERRRHQCWPLAQGRDPPSPASSRADPTPQSAFPTGHRDLCLASPAHASCSESAEPGASPGPPTPASQDGARGCRPSLGHSTGSQLPASRLSPSQAGACGWASTTQEGG